jgi:hypothetical protein
MPIGPSLDHVMAQQLSPEGVPLLLNTVGRISESPQSAISYSAPETLFQAQTATSAFNGLTGLFAPNAPINGDSWAVAKGKALTDIVKDDLTRLRRHDMSKDDQRKLEAWMDLANQVGGMVASSVQCSQALAMQLGASSQLNTTTDDGFDALTRKVSDTMDNADLYSAIAVLAVACNANPVVVLKHPGNFTYTGLGITNDSDNLAHRLDNAGMQGICASNVIEKLLKIDGYNAQKFANLVKLLDSIQEGDGTLLDNTVAIWMNECSDGCAHNLNNAPIIQAGSGGGYFKTGRVVHLDPGSGATAPQMLGHSLDQCTDDADMMVDGVDQITGTDPRFGNAPVNKYYCNIMKAMGLSADATGYAAKGGDAAEVTHFGYSDKTEDFCGGAGAVAGAGIHDPGAFDQLEA